MCGLHLCVAQDYSVPLLTGDYPDPTILRDGDDYYMTHSPFVYMPGFLIWHSTDVVHWTPIGRALPETGGDLWAADLVKHGGKYYIYYPANGTNYVIWSDNICGEWSKPIDLHIAGIDPGHVVGQDGTRWLHTSGGYVVRLSDDGLSVVGKQEHVYDGWKYPDTWQTECFCLEGPKLTYHNGWYYLTSAQGGTAGPATSHMVVTARSKSPTGPWENSPYNPIVHTYNSDEAWWSRGHGSLVEGPSGEWWMVYHAYRKGYHTLGRQTLLVPIEWTCDGWFRTCERKGLPLHATMPSLNDDFTSGTLGWQWTFWKEYAPESLHWTHRGLTIDGKGMSPHDGRLLLAITQDTCYEATVDIDLERKAMGGLLLYYNEQAYAGLTASRDELTIVRQRNDSETLPNAHGRRMSVRLTNRQNHVQLAVSTDGRKTWHTLANDVDATQLHHNKYGQFLSLRIGLLSAGSGATTFSHFTYRSLDNLGYTLSSSSSALHSLARDLDN